MGAGLAIGLVAVALIAAAICGILFAFFPEVLPPVVHDLIRQQVQRRRESYHKKRKSSSRKSHRHSTERRESAKKFSVDKRGNRFYREKLRFSGDQDSLAAAEPEGELAPFQVEHDEGGDSPGKKGGSKVKSRLKGAAKGVGIGVGALVASPLVVSGLAAEKAGSLVSSKLSRKHDNQPVRVDSHVGSLSEEPVHSRKSMRRASKEKSMAAKGERYDVEPIESHSLLKATLKGFADLTVCAAFSPDGHFVATAGGPADPSIRLTVRRTLGLNISLARQQVVPLPFYDWVSGLTFSHSDSFFLVATTHGGHAVVYRVFRQISKKAQLELHFKTLHSTPVVSCFMGTVPSFPESYMISTIGSGTDKTIKFWSFGKKAKLVYEKTFANKHSLVQAKFLRGGKTVALMDETEGRPRDDEEDGPLRELSMYSVRFSNRGAFKKTWTVDTIEQQELDLKDAKHSSLVSFCQHSHHMVSCSRDSWNLWRLKDSRLLQLAFMPSTASDSFNCVAFSELQRVVVASRGTELHFYHLTGDDSLPKLTNIVRNALDSDIVDIIVSPEEDSVLTVGANSKSARIWSLSA